jgi:hypothetical protein
MAGALPPAPVPRFIAIFTLLANMRCLSGIKVRSIHLKLLYVRLATGGSVDFAAIS